MAAFFSVGEQKVRPGVYFNYENFGTPPIAGAADGVCAAVFRSNWGPIGSAVLLELDDFNAITRQFGSNGTTDVPFEMFRGGARSVYATRLGSGGTKGTYSIKSSTGTTLINLVLRYPGSRQFQIVIRQTLEDDQMKELLLVEDTTILQTMQFAKDTTDEVAPLLAAYAVSGSNWFTLDQVGTAKGALAIVDQVPITPGTDPTINTAAYSTAFEALEPYRWNVIGLDTNDPAAQALMQAFLSRLFLCGKFVMGVVGDPTTIPFATRLARAKAFNDYRIVYVASGWKDSSGAVYAGYLAAARIAGMIAGTPSKESITHLPITGAVELTESLTNSQYIQTINSGMLVFSVSSLGNIWVESAVNTLTSISNSSKDDTGWKKIKRVKVRFELMQRINDTVEPLVGRVNNDPDGRANVLQTAQGVLNIMMAENKILSGAKVIMDSKNPPKGDSAWFLVYADDIDAMEKMYFTFKFRFAPEE